MLMLFAFESQGLAAAARVIATTGVPPHKEIKKPLSHRRKTIEESHLSLPAA